MSVMNTLGNVALVGGAAVAGVALGGEGLADWLDGNEGQDVNQFWVAAADGVRSAQCGIHSAAQSVGGSLGVTEGNAAIVTATAAAVLGVGTKLATSYASHDSTEPCRPNVPNLHADEHSR